MAAGNTQAATAILSDWFAATSGGDSSLMDRALESGEANVSWETIKALGALKFLDDPRSMVREVGGGMLEADAGGGGRAGGAGAGSALAALFEGSTAVAGAGGPGKARSVDEAEADPAGGGGRAEAYTPRRPTEAVAVDLETLGAERAEKAAKADGDGEEPDSGGDGPAELPDVETDDTGGAPGLDEAMDGIEDEIDREAGEYPNAAEAMQTLDEAAEADDAASAKRRRRQ